MASQGKRLRPEIIFLGLVVLLLLITLVTDWWGKNPIMAWSIFAVFLLSLAYALFKYSIIRQFLLRSIWPAPNNDTTC